MAGVDFPDEFSVAGINQDVVVLRINQAENLHSAREESPFDGLESFDFDELFFVEGNEALVFMVLEDGRLEVEQLGSSSTLVLSLSLEVTNQVLTVLDSSAELPDVILEELLEGNPGPLLVRRKEDFLEKSFQVRKLVSEELGVEVLLEGVEEVGERYEFLLFEVEEDLSESGLILVLEEGV